MSPSGVYSQTVGCDDTVVQNVSSAAAASRGGLPAISAELIAPIETPAIQLGSQLASASA